MDKTRFRILLNCLRLAVKESINERTGGGVTNTDNCCYCTVLYCTVLHCTVLYCTVLYCTVLYCTVLYCTALHCTVLYCTVLYCTVLYCTALYCTVLYCTVLYCTVLYCNQVTFSCQLGIAGHVFLWANSIARAQHLFLVCFMFSTFPLL